MNRSLIIGMALIVAAGSLGGCTDFRRALGIEKAPPDEFTVVQNAPLTLPPDYGLRPPHSATGKPATPAPMEQAREAVFKVGQHPANTSDSSSLTSGEQALLVKAGALNADSSIRATVDAETQQVATASDSFVDSLLFWRSPPTPAAGTPVDAAGEAKRVEVDQAEGKSAVQPSIERTQRTNMEGLL
ncbi:MAG TPA: DUF3035 domain-containing protein [Stellaceae bacterium]|nr:DUF3035 domain-containing protein [Stellaceae bacterium]